MTLRHITFERQAMKKTRLYLSLLCLYSTIASAADGRAIMRRVFDRDDGATEVSRIKLSTCLIARKGQSLVCRSAPRVKVMDMVRKDYGPNEKDHRTVTVIIDPPGEKGISFLQYDYEQRDRETDQWLYLSALRKVKRIVSGNENEPKSGSFFGSELSYEDMEKRHLDDYTYTVLGQERYADRPCWVIETTPTKERAGKSNYAKSLDWIDQERYLVLKSVLFDRKGKKAKRIYFGKITRIQDILVPMRIVILNIKTARRTVMTVERTALNVAVEDGFLTQRTLTDGAFRESRLREYQQTFDD